MHEKGNQALKATRVTWECMTCHIEKMQVTAKEYRILLSQWFRREGHSLSWTIVKTIRNKSSEIG